MSDTPHYDVVVVGGGAAGFFGAIQIAEKRSGIKILILEKSNKLLAKVRISGGGRCNVTHHCFEPNVLSKHYPRGQRQLKKLFTRYQAQDVVNWFEQRGVKLKVEGDGRMFPTTNNSETIINCFLREADRYSIKVLVGHQVNKVRHTDSVITLTCTNEQEFTCERLLVAAGGHPNREAYKWIENLGHTVTPLMPSLFTFNDSEKKFVDLMGVSVESASVQIAGTKFRESGPVLITHWGLSGPAVIKLSAWAAEYLAERHYTFTALVNWTGNVMEDEARKELESYCRDHPKQKVENNSLYHLPGRLWERLCEQSEIEKTRVWSELSKKQLNKLVENLVRCQFKIKGKTTFKEEFVTCGGVDLAEIELENMESKKFRGVYFAGEVLNIDGETGGFNFQSAWTTAYTAAEAIATKSLK
ncbi:MAG: NAD(P)/FAD-dependent oxidoreductase [Cyclobacteriaceae bacterium]|nr:NAD(P)/FAD-dependent oxidoreductase [Cyclobacteriaceae bacterium]